MVDGQFGTVYPGVDMLSAILGEGSLEGAPAPVVQERAEGLLPRSGSGDYRDADGVVDAACPRIPGGEGGPVVFGGHSPGMSGAAGLG
jgi:hypothetical protein